MHRPTHTRPILDTYARVYHPAMWNSVTTLGEVVRIPPTPIIDLVRRLSIVRPKWDFIEYRYHPRYEVFEGTNYLGDVWYSKDDSKYSINCERLGSRRSRGEATTTRNIDTAYKTILREFKTKTTTAMVHEKTASLADAFRSVSDVAAMRHKSRMTYVLPHIESLVFSDIEKYTPLLTAQGIDPAILDAAIETKTALVKWGSFGAVGAKLQVVVVVDGDYYLPSGEHYTDDTLPIEFRQNLGLLKLVDDGVSLLGVGFRAGADRFMVAPT